jgi:hypothetical protein
MYKRAAPRMIESTILSACGDSRIERLSNHFQQRIPWQHQKWQGKLYAGEAGQIIFGKICD